MGHQHPEWEALALRPKASCSSGSLQGPGPRLTALGTRELPSPAKRGLPASPPSCSS